MSSLKFTATLWWLSIAGVAVGLVAGLMGGSLLGVGSTQFLLGGVGLALLSLNFSIVDDPRCPRCPPVCPWVCYGAVVLFVLAILAALFFGGEILGVSAGEFYHGFVAFAFLCLAARLPCVLDSLSGKSGDGTIQ